VVERAIAALAVMGQTWENSRPEESESLDKWTMDHVTIARAFAALLQQAWLTPLNTLVNSSSFLN